MVDVDAGMNFQDVLTENLDQFSRYVMAEDYVNPLVESRVLSFDDAELILNRYTNQTRRQRAVKLIEVLMTRGPAGYKKFMELLEYQCPHVYEKITHKQPRKPPPGFQRSRNSDRLRLMNELPMLAQHIKEQFNDNIDLNCQLSILQNLLELSDEEKSELEKEIDGLKKLQPDNDALTDRLARLQNENNEQQSAMNGVMQRCLACTEERDKYRERCEWLQLQYDDLYKQLESARTANTNTEDNSNVFGPPDPEDTAQPHLWNQALGRSRRPSDKLERPSVPPKPPVLGKSLSQSDVPRDREDHRLARQNIIVDELDVYKAHCEDIARQLEHAETELAMTEQLLTKAREELGQVKKTVGMLERQLTEAGAKHDSYFKTIQGKCNDIAELHAEREKEATRLKEVTLENTEMREHVHDLEKENSRLKWQLERANLDGAAGDQGARAQAAPQTNDLEERTSPNKSKHRQLCRLVYAEVYMRFTDLRKVMFTDAEGGGEHHFSQRNNVHRDGVFGSFGMLPGDADGDTNTSREAPFLPNALPSTGIETTETIFKREVALLRNSSSNSSMMTQQSFKVKACLKRGDNVTTPGNVSGSENQPELELAMAELVSRVCVTPPPDSDDSGDYDNGTRYASSEPQSPEPETNQNPPPPRTQGASDVYTVLLPRNPIPVQEPAYPRLMLQHVTVKFPILNDKLEICGGNHTGIFINSVHCRSINLRPGDEIKEILYKPGQPSHTVKAVLYGATLEDATKLLGKEFIQPKKEREIKLGFSRNSHEYERACKWMVENNDTGDYVFIRCNKAVDHKSLEEISLKPGDVFLVKNSYYDGKHWSGYKVQTDTGQCSHEMQIIPNLQRARYCRLQSSEQERESTVRNRGFKMKGMTYVRVLPMKVANKMPVMVMGPKDLVTAMLAFVAARGSPDFCVESSDPEAADHDNSDIGRQDCHIVRHGTFDQLSANKHVQKIIVRLHVTSVPSQRELRGLFDSDCGVCEAMVAECLKLRQRLSHSEEICFPAVSSAEVLWERFQQCVCTSQDRIVWLSSSEMDEAVATRYTKFLGQGCDLAQIASAIHNANSFDDN